MKQESTLRKLTDRMREENPVLEPAPGIAQGILSQARNAFLEPTSAAAKSLKDGLAQLMPGQPLRGTPPPRPVGPPLPGLPFGLAGVCMGST